MPKGLLTMRLGQTKDALSTGDVYFYACITDTTDRSVNIPSGQRNEYCHIG